MEHLGHQLSSMNTQVDITLAGSAGIQTAALAYQVDKGPGGPGYRKYYRIYNGTSMDK
jgi:hypothetical protein